MTFNPRAAAIFIYEFCNGTGLPSFEDRERAGLAELDGMTDAELTNEVKRFNSSGGKQLQISDENLVSLKRSIRKWLISLEAKE